MILVQNLSCSRCRYLLLAHESVITNGRIDPKKLKPIAYDPCNNTYTALGDVVGKAFGDGMKLK